MESNDSIPNFLLDSARFYRKFFYQVWPGTFGSILYITKKIVILFILFLIIYFMF